MILRQQNTLAQFSFVLKSRSDVVSCRWCQFVCIFVDVVRLGAKDFGVFLLAPLPCYSIELSRAAEAKCCGEAWVLGHRFTLYYRDLRM